MELYRQCFTNVYIIESNAFVCQSLEPLSYSSSRSYLKIEEKFSTEKAKRFDFWKWKRAPCIFSIYTTSMHLCVFQQFFLLKEFLCRPFLNGVFLAYHVQCLFQIQSSFSVCRLGSFFSWKDTLYHLSICALKERRNLLDALHEIVEILRTRARKVTTFESYIYTTNVCMFPRNNFLATMVDNIGLTITSIRYGRNLRLLAQRQYIYASNSAIASMCIGWKHIGERKIVTTSQSFFESFHESLKNIVKYRLNGGKITQSKAVIVFSRWLNNKIAFQSATTRRNVTYVLYLQQASK